MATRRSRPQPAPPVDLDHLPGHHIRRLHQISVALFLQETERHALTPVQYAALHTVVSAPGLDQRRLSARIGIDPSTVGSVIDRLEARGLLSRQASAQDRRAKQLVPTAAGQALLAAVTGDMLRAQERILEPLPAAERPEFMRMLRVLVEGNNELSRAPSRDLRSDSDADGAGTGSARNPNG